MVFNLCGGTNYKGPLALMPIFPPPPHVMVASEPERIGVFLTRSCVQLTDISCGVVYEATLASLVLFRSYCYVKKGKKT